MKFCHTCSKSKEISAFSKSSKNKDGLQNKCKSCMSAYRANRQKDDTFRKTNSERKRVWRQKNSNREKQYHDSYRIENSDKRKAWRQEHRFLLNRLNQTYYFKKISNVGFLPKDYLQIMEDLYSRKCAKCSTSKDLHVDHIIPVSKNGPSCLSNFQFLCVSCNCSKGNRNSSDYRSFDDVIKLLDLLMEKAG